MKVLLIAIAVLALSSIAKANLTSGELRANCEEAEKIHGDQSGNGTLGGICLGFIQGFVETLNLGMKNYIVADGRVFAVTMQDGVTTGQMVRVYLKWITNHPEEENKPAIQSLELALLESKLATSEMVGTFQPTPAK